MSGERQKTTDRRRETANDITPSHLRPDKNRMHRYPRVPKNVLPLRNVQSHVIQGTFVLIRAVPTPLDL